MTKHIQTGLDTRRTEELLAEGRSDSVTEPVKAARDAAMQRIVEEIVTLRKQRDRLAEALRY